MLKKFRIYFIASIIAIYAVFTVILFVTLPDGRASQGAFWFNFVFGIIIPLLVTLGVFFFTLGNKKFEAVTLPGVYYLVAIFDGVLLILDGIFMYANNKLTAPIVLNIIILVAEAIVIGFALLSSNYIAENQAKQKKKVFYIRDLQGDVDAASNLISDADTKKKMMQLSEDIRYSDPMSDDSLADTEEDIKNKVNKLVSLSRNNDLERINPLIDEISNLIKYRNTKCKNLKARSN